jgi:hypothetical protein
MKPVLNILFDIFTVSYLILFESNLEFGPFSFFTRNILRKNRKFDDFPKLLLPALKRERPVLPISGILNKDMTRGSSQDSIL